MGTDSFNLPPDLDANNNDGDSTKGDGGSAGGDRKTQNEGVLFDEFGRYIIENYDALPPFSDILPVRYCPCE
jgi:hypothetical protein